MRAELLMLLLFVRRVPLIIRPHPHPRGVWAPKGKLLHAAAVWRGRIACFEVSTPIIVLISCSDRTRAIALINRVVVRGCLLITATGLPSGVVASSSKGANPVRRQSAVPAVNGKTARGMLGIGIVVYNNNNNNNNYYYYY